MSRLSGAQRRKRTRKRRIAMRYQQLVQRYGERFAKERMGR